MITSTMDNVDTFVPMHDRDSIERYIEHGIIPGSFLQAIICNDLRMAVSQADRVNTAFIPTIVRWFYNYAPSQCCGSKGRMMAWAGEFVDRRNKEKSHAVTDPAIPPQAP